MYPIEKPNPYFLHLFSILFNMPYAAVYNDKILSTHNYKRKSNTILHTNATLAKQISILIHDKIKITRTFIRFTESFRIENV